MWLIQRQRAKNCYSAGWLGLLHRGFFVFFGVKNIRAMFKGKRIAASVFQKVRSANRGPDPDWPWCRIYCNSSSAASDRPKTNGITSYYMLWLLWVCTLLVWYVWKLYWYLQWNLHLLHTISDLGFRAKVEMYYNWHITKIGERKSILDMDSTEALKVQSSFIFITNVRKKVKRLRRKLKRLR